MLTKEKFNALLQYSLRYEHDFHIVGIMSIFFLILFGVMTWYSLSPDKLGKKNSTVQLFRVLIVLSLLYPIGAIIEYDILRG